MCLWRSLSHRNPTRLWNNTHSHAVRLVYVVPTVILSTRFRYERQKARDVRFTVIAIDVRSGRFDTRLDIGALYGRPSWPSRVITLLGSWSLCWPSWASSWVKSKIKFWTICMLVLESMPHMRIMRPCRLIMTFGVIYSFGGDTYIVFVWLCADYLTSFV